jgi:hypothetical protein
MDMPRSWFALLFLVSISSLAYAACKQECDYWYDSCLNDTHHTSNDVSGGADDVYPAYKYNVANLYYCSKYNSSYRQDFLKENPGFDVGTCDCVPSYLSCLKSLYEKYSSYEETGTHAKQCAVPAAACYNAFRATTCPIEKAACYKKCGIPSSGGTGGSGTGGTSPGGTSDPCATKSCDKDSCRIVGGKAIWYSGGTCVNGDCQYNALDCKAGCNKAGDGCAEQVKVDVFLMEPYDNQQIDSQGGPATVQVIGVIRGSAQGDFSKAMVSIPNVMMPKSLPMDGDRFSGEIELPGPGEYEVKVEAFDSGGNIVSSDKSKVMVGAAFSMITYWEGTARLMRDGKEMVVRSGDVALLPGDEITILTGAGGYIEYSDGTKAFLNEGVTVRKVKDGSFVLMLGDMEISGDYAHSFDTRFGVAVMKGTSFKINVDDFRTRVYVTKGSVELFSLSDTVGTVQAGQYGDIMRNGDITVYSAQGSVVDTSKPTGQASPMDPTTHKAAGCCGGAFILAAVAAFSMRR